MNSAQVTCKTSGVFPSFLYTTNNGKTTWQTNCLTDPLVAVAQSGNLQGIVWKYIMEIKRFLSNVHDIVDLGKLSQETVLKLISVRSICQKSMAPRWLKPCFFSSFNS